MKTKNILIKAAFWISVATLGSRMLGFLREIQLAYYFGLSPMRGAFTVAFKIPNLLRVLIADAAISAAFIPVLTEYLLKKEKKEAWQIASQVLNLTFLILSVIVILCELFMPWIIRITTPGFVSDPFLFEHTVRLSRVIFPIVMILGLSGIVVGVLHSLKHFSAPAVAPIFWNLTNLAAVLLLQERFGIYAAAWGLLAATLIQLMVQGCPFLKIRWTYSFKLGLSHPAVRQIGSLMIPVTLSIGVITINSLVDNFFASLLGPAEIAAIDSAFRLFHLPQGLFAIAIGTVLFPVLAGLVVEKNFSQFAETLQTGIRQIFFVTLPFMGWFMVLALPIARLCFERGNFTADDSQMVAWGLMFFSMGMVFTSANTLLNRGFYSLKKMWIPLYVGGINIILNAFFDWWLMEPFGLGGICFSTALVSTFNFFALVLLLNRQVREFRFQTIGRAFFRMVPLAAILTGTSFFTWQMMDLSLGRSLGAQVLSLGAGLMAGALIYGALALLLRFKEAKEILVLLKRG